jgi:hypothetical protein
MSDTSWLVVAIVAGALLVVGWVSRSSRSTAVAGRGPRADREEMKA